ncbi:MAG: hypothetical protein EBR71_11915 [Planctomycetes bacterium]|nr:hypothetical protein [Planctomycetota bacterium]
MTGGSLVVLHVTRTLNTFGIEIAFELAEDVAVALSDNIGENIESSPVGHADDHVAGPVVGGSTDDGIEGHDGGFTTFETKTLLSDVAGVEELLKDFSSREFLHDALLSRRCHGGGNPFESLLEPLLLIEVHDVHELHAHRAAVGITQDRERLIQCGVRLAGEAVDNKGSREVPNR